MNFAQGYETQGHQEYQQGHYLAARHAFEQALAAATAQPEIDLQHIAQLWNNIGFVCRALHDSTTARHAYQQALAIHRSAPNPNYLDLGIALHNLGRLLQAQGDHNLAWTHMREELDIWKQHTSEPNIIPHLAACLYALGEIMADAGEYPRARRNFEQALELREVALGLDHADTAENLAGLGMLCLAQGETAAAQRYLARAIPLFTAALGPDHAVVRQLHTALADATSPSSV
jgi:tetratricopeptide (TPR) repeat protein